MKKRSIVYVIAVVAAITTVSIYGSMNFTEDKSLGRSGIPPRFHLKTNFPVIGSDTLSVYKIVPDEFDSRHLAEIGKKFDLNGEIEYMDDDVFSATYILTGDDGKFLEYHTQTGVWIYVDPDEAYPTVYEEPNLPDDSEAQQIAKSFLKENGFWSEDIVSSEVGHQIQGFGIKGTGEVIDEWIITKEVYFGKKLDGLPLIGEKATVTIVEGGKVASFIQSTRTFQVTGNASLITPEKAFENLQEGKGIRCRCRTVYADRDIDIENIYLCYYVDSILKDPGPIVPCYAFEGKFRDTGDEFSTFVNAVEI